MVSRIFKSVLATIMVLLLYGFCTEEFFCTEEIKSVNTDFSIVELPDDKIERVISTLQIKKCDVEPPKTGILCFDVNELDMIAICQKVDDEGNVCIYNQDGNYIFGYSFRLGQGFSAELNTDSLNIYLKRSGVLISLDFEGNVIDVSEVLETVENNQYQNYLNSAIKEACEKTYQLGNNLGPLDFIAFSYSRLMVTEPDGNTRIIYDIRSEKLFSIIFWIISCTSVAVIVSFIIKKYFR